MYSVFDAKAEMHLPPFTAKKVGEATRAFTQSVQTPQHPFNAFPLDYSLFYVGRFDDSKGLLLSEKAPKMIMTGSEARKSLEVTK